MPLALLVMAIVIPATAFGHAERFAYFPDHTLGKVPKLRSSGPSLVVCKSDSGRRIAKLPQEKRVVIHLGFEDREARRRTLLPRMSKSRPREIPHREFAICERTDDDRVLPARLREQPQRRSPVLKCPRRFEGARQHH